MGEKPIAEIVEPSKKQVEEQAKDIIGRELDIHFVGNKDSRFVYRWLNTHKQNLETKKARGWEIVQDKNIKTLSGSDGTTHQIGDLILARMPKDLHEKLMAEKKRLGDERRRSTPRQFREYAAQHGIKTFEEK